MLGPDTLGIEVTDPALAAGCGLGRLARQQDQCQEFSTASLPAGLTFHEMFCLLAGISIMEFIIRGL